MFSLMFPPTALLQPSGNSLTSDGEENDFVTNGYNMLKQTRNKSGNSRQK